MDEMKFDEFRKMMLSLGNSGDDGAMGEFTDFLGSGCTEAEAKQWLGEHIWDFDDEMRKELTMLFESDALNQSAKKAAEQKKAPAPERRSTVWTICAKYRSQIGASLWNRYPWAGLTRRGGNSSPITSRNSRNRCRRN